MKSGSRATKTGGCATPKNILPSVNLFAGIHSSEVWRIRRHIHIVRRGQTLVGWSTSAAKAGFECERLNRSAGKRCATQKPAADICGLTATVALEQASQSSQRQRLDRKIIVLGSAFGRAQRGALPSRFWVAQRLWRCDKNPHTKNIWLKPQR
jgi:hypothetical protein